MTRDLPQVSFCETKTHSLKWDAHQHSHSHAHTMAGRELQVCCNSRCMDNPFHYLHKAKTLQNEHSRGFAAQKSQSCRYETCWNPRWQAVKRCCCAETQIHATPPLANRDSSCACNRHFRWHVQAHTARYQFVCTPDRYPFTQRHVRLDCRMPWKCELVALVMGIFMVISKNEYEEYSLNSPFCTRQGTWNT